MPVDHYYGGDKTPLSEEQVAAYARSASFGVPVGYIVGMALRESGWKPNEVDYDVDADGNRRPLLTYGLLQVNREEAIAALELPTEAAMCDPETNIRILCSVTAKRRAALEVAASDYSEDDMLAYLCIAHNQGLGAALKTVNQYGMDWAAYSARNPTSRIVPYANAVLEYVRKYPSAPDSQGSDDSGGYEVGQGSDAMWWIKMATFALIGWGAWRYSQGQKVVPV